MSRKRDNDDPREAWGRAERQLAELEKTTWSYVGEMAEVVDPGDNDELALIWEVASVKLRRAKSDERRQRLQEICHRLRTQIVLNMYLPQKPP